VSFDFQVLTYRMPSILSDFKEMFLEQAEYKELLYQVTLRDLRLRYKQTIMGFGWAVFMPLLNTALFSVIFVRVAPVDTGVPYPVWVYCGLAVWNFFSAGVKFATNSLASNMNLVTKVYFPREILPLSAVLVSAVDFLVSTTVLAVLMAWYGVKPGWPLLFVPYLLLVHIMLTAAVSLFLSMANVFYRDVKYLVEALMMLWMFATSVVYPIELIGGRLGAVMALNPMTPLVDAFRAAVLYNRPPSAAGLLYVTIVAVISLAGSWVLFHRAEFKFAESV
jgi:lipopolysaccharide transport system permease protein